MTSLDSGFRRARPEDMDRVYLMGYDAWGEGAAVEEYLRGCRGSTKYRSGRWFVLCRDGTPVSSLLVHGFPSWGERVVRGIGSVATGPAHRRRGFGSRIVRSAVSALAGRERAGVILLYSDIDPAFYEALGFTRLPARFQGSPGSTLMAWLAAGADGSLFEEHEAEIPRYF